MTNRVYTLHTERTNIIYYLHGGGFALEMAPYYFDFFERICNKCNCGIIVPIYPKTPKFNYSHIFRMVKDNYLDIKNKNVILMGDSAGGGLCYMLCNQLENNDYPLNIITISPWLDLCSDNKAMQEYQKNDRFLTQPLLKKFAKDFAFNIKLNNSLINPYYSNNNFFKNSIILMGTYDILCPDAIKFQKKFNCELRLYEKAPHCFALLKEQKDAFDDLVKFTLQVFQ